VGRLEVSARTSDQSASRACAGSTEDFATAVDSHGMTIEQLIPGFQPETALERTLASDPALLRGLAWGRPRPGHPEGSVGVHVGHILAGITETPGRRRSELRFVALVHDAFKHRVRRDMGYSPDNDHAVLARRFAQGYTRDARLLVTLELHDEPYRIWRTRGDDRRAAIEAVLARIPDLGLFLRFVELDGTTMGKDPRPLAWLHDVVAAQAAPRVALAA
jgi:hypothetical protein